MAGSCYTAAGRHIYVVAFRRVRNDVEIGNQVEHVGVQMQQTADLKEKLKTKDIDTTDDAWKPISCAGI